MPLSNSEAREILRRASLQLQRKDSARDTSTRIEFALKGDRVRTLPRSLPRTIKTRRELERVLNSREGIKVVQQINYCTKPNSDAIGCGNVGSETVRIVVARTSSLKEPQLWAHEFGHNSGLEHEKGSPSNLMYRRIGSRGNREVTPAQARAILRGPSGKTQSRSPSYADVDNVIDARKTTLEEFIFDEAELSGLLEDDTSRFGSESVPQLLRWLRDAEAADLSGTEYSGIHHHAFGRIVSVLGLIGDARATIPLIELINGRYRGENAFRAKNDALFHLGDLARKSGDDRAFTYLRNFILDPSRASGIANVRREKQIVEAARNNFIAASSSELQEELLDSAIYGMGHIGTRAARNVLTRSWSIYRDQSIRDAIEAAIRDCDVLIKNNGEFPDNYFSEEDAARLD